MTYSDAVACEVTLRPEEIAKMNDGQFHVLVCSREAKVERVYIDGVVVREGQIPEPCEKPSFRIVSSELDKAREGCRKTVFEAQKRRGLAELDAAMAAHWTVYAIETAFGPEGEGAEIDRYAKLTRYAEREGR